jgi:hypothetical protein
MNLTRISLAAAAAAAAAALAPASALADAPWTTPATVAGASGYRAQLVYTPSGQASLVTDAPGNRTLVTAVGDDGRPGTPRALSLASAQVATYGNSAIAVAGTRTATDVPQASRAPVELGTGTASIGVATVHPLPGTAGQQLYALAGRGKTVALVTGAPSSSRIVWVRRGGTVRRALMIHLHSHPRGATVAVGAKGDVLVVWEDNHTIYSRHRGAGGRWGSVQRLGAGVQSSLQAVFDDSGRQEVAWMSQRVNEGGGGNATVSYTSAARGRAFTKPVAVGSPSGTGHVAAAPGVRLVASGTDSSVLALTVYDGAQFRTAVANVAAGQVQTPQMVSPDGEDDVLSDLAYARAGGTLVLWRSGSGPQRLYASVRPSGAAAFGAPELVSDPAQAVPQRGYGAVDPITGTALAGFGYLNPQVVVSARASSSAGTTSGR